MLSFFLLFSAPSVKRDTYIFTITQISNSAITSLLNRIENGSLKIDKKKIK